MVAGRWRDWSLGLLIWTVVGCGEDRHLVGPPPPDLPFNPELTANSIYSLRFAADNAIVVQVGTIAAALGLSEARANRAVSSGGGASLGRASLRRAAELRSLGRALAHVAARRAQGAKVPLFPINFLGKVFVFDPAREAYVEFGDGGPERGVRFALYVVDLSSGLPALPLRRFGHVDLTDESDAVSARLRVRAFDTRGGGISRLADYVVDGAYASHGDGVSVSLMADGFAEDENGRFDFELEELLESDDAAGMTYVGLRHTVLSAEGTEVRLRVDGDLSVDGRHADLLFRMDIDGSAGLTLLYLSVVNGTQEGEISHSGRVEAGVAGTVEAPVFSDLAGRGFTAAEAAALDEILFGIDDVLAFAGEAYLPLADLFTRRRADARFHRPAAHGLLGGGDLGQGAADEDRDHGAPPFRIHRDVGEWVTLTERLLGHGLDYS